jgi:hypothetical protein
MEFASAAIAVGVCGIFLCAGYAALHWFDRYSVAVDARLAEMAYRPTVVAPHRSADETEPPSYLSQWRAAVNRLVANSEDRGRCQTLLLHAGLYRPAALSVFFSTKLALMVVPPVVGMLAGCWGLFDVEIGLLWGRFGWNGESGDDTSNCDGRLPIFSI